MSKLRFGWIPILCVLIACSEESSSNGFDAIAPPDADAAEDTGGPRDTGAFDAADAGSMDADAEAADADVGADADAGADADVGADADGGGDPECDAPVLERPALGYSGPAPEAYYTFDDAHVEGTNVFNGVATSTTLGANVAAQAGLGVPGVVDGAAEFDGAASIVSGPIDKSSRFTVATWIRLRTRPSPERTVALNVGNGPSAWQGWGLAVRTNGQVAVFVEGGGGAQNEHVVATERCVPLERWTHVAATMDGAEVRLYRDGLLQGRVPVNRPDINFGSRGLVLGYHSFFQGFYFDGDLDEVAIWNQVIDEDGIEEVYLAGRDGLHFVCPSACAARAAPTGPLPTSGLVTWLRADRGVVGGPDGDVCTWCDFSGAGHHFVQLDPTQTPTVAATGAGGHPALEFSGSDALTRDDALGIADASGRTFAAVSQLIDVSARTTAVFQGVPGTPGTYLMLEANTFATARDRFGAYVTNNAYDAPTSTDRDPHVHVMRMSTMTPGEPVLSALDLWLDGAEQALSRTPGGLGNGNIESFPARASAVGGVVGVRSSQHRLSEVMIWDRPLDSAEREQLEDYARDRYGITLDGR